MGTVRALVLTGGHPFDRGSFVAMLEALPGVVWEHVEHPEAIDRLAPGRVGADVVLAYDMPGIGFRRGQLPELVPPPDRLVEGMSGLLDAGQPFVFLHHAICSWPTWPGFAEIVGGRFHYVAADLRGTDWPDSGYRHDVRQTLTVVDPEHPLAAGLPLRFELIDETYVCPVFEDDVTPVLMTDASRADRDHYSATLAVTGRRDSNEGWQHPAGSRVAAWVRRAGNSPVAYIQPGDGPGAFTNPHYRQLVANAVHWAAG